MTAIDSTTLGTRGWTSLFWPNDNFGVFKVNGRLARQFWEVTGERGFRMGENAQENRQSQPNGVWHLMLEFEDGTKQMSIAATLRATTRSPATSGLPMAVNT